eukprot:TRINITY_DN782_c0_g1_i4.p1 TRINITY_DN782_c0_g1~~TRINITY_DN782_c0_g1_i4.p1  ORF type:complete len:575 (+),score=44.40 TRINITY_DN782_c0_g1_i4:248-1972(+)
MQSKSATKCGTTATPQLKVGTSVGSKYAGRTASCGSVGNNHNKASTQSAETPLIDTEEFRMFAYKVVPCSKRYRHDWSACPYAHQGEKAKRRDPRLYQYVAIVCVDMKTTGQCARGDACPFCHNVFELWLHPTRYRTQLCNNGANCDRKVCFFAHSLDQLRTTPGQFVNEKVEQYLGSNIMANPEVVKAIFSLEQNRGNVNIDKEATLKLAALQSQLLGNQKLFQEILSYNKVDTDGFSKPNLHFMDRAQTLHTMPALPANSSSLPAPVAATAPAASARAVANLPEGNGNYFLTKTDSKGHPTSISAVQDQVDPLAQLLAITQKPSRFSTESLNSPLDSLQSPQSPHNNSMGDVFNPNLYPIANSISNTNPQGGNNSNNSSAHNLFFKPVPEVQPQILGSAQNGGNFGSASANLEFLIRANNIMAGNGNTPQLPMEPANLQTFLSALSASGSNMDVGVATAPRVLAHQDSGSSYGSSTSQDCKNTLNTAQAKSFSGMDANGQQVNYQNAMASITSASANNILSVGNDRPHVVQNMLKFNSFPLSSAAVDEKKLAECVEYLHLFEEEGNADQYTP